MLGTTTWWDPGGGTVDMALGEAARVARRDQALAAQADVLGILDDLVRDRTQWRRIDERTQRAIEAMVARLVAIDADSDLVCPHARQGALDWAPRPLVLDVVLGILACWEDCYWSRAQADPGSSPIDARCFDCGRRMILRPGRDLLVAYGSILVVAALCPRCRGSVPSRPAPGSTVG